jgi:hypothetical protein
LRKRGLSSSAHFRTPNKQDQKRTSPGHTVVKTLNIQKNKKILKTAREKHQVTYKSNPI